MKVRIAALCALTGSAVLLLAGPAVAHVTVQPESAQQGSFTKLVFRVPNESADASTNKIEVNLPVDHPVASVQTTPIPGWKVQVTKDKLAKPLEREGGAKITEAITKITWTGGSIAPGTFQEFPISMGPLPEDANSMVFKTLQTYTGGEVVRWIEAPQAGDGELEHPAPVLALTPPARGGAGQGDANNGAPERTSADTADNKGGDNTAGDTTNKATATANDNTARALGIVGIVVGVIGSAIGGYGLRRAKAAGGSAASSSRMPAA